MNFTTGSIYVYLSGISLDAGRCKSDIKFWIAEGTEELEDQNGDGVVDERDPCYNCSHTGHFRQK